MRNSNMPRLNWFNSRARSNFNKPLRRSKMRSNALSNYRMKFSILAEPMHIELLSRWVRRLVLQLKSSTAGNRDKAAVLCRFQLKLGRLACAFKHRAFSTVTAVFITLQPWVFLSACSQKNAETPAPAAAEKKEESRVTHGTSGEAIIKLDAETQKLMGL